MSFGKTVYQELLSIIADPDYGDITDVKSGRDIVVEYIPQEKSDTNFAKTMVRPKPNQTPLSPDAETVQRFLAEQPDLKVIFKEPTYEELKLTLERYLDPSVVSGPTPIAKSEPITSPTAAKSQEIKSPVKDMIDEFDEVFN
jgi:hypothetical protein